MPKAALFRSGRPKRTRSRGSQSPAVPPPRSTLAEQVYQQLRRDIIHGVFQSGEAINEKVLAKRYHGSRTPVREAVMRFMRPGNLMYPQPPVPLSRIAHDIVRLADGAPELRRGRH